MRITELPAGSLQSTDYMAVDDATLGTRRLPMAKFVSYDAQSPTTSEQAQARANIGVGSASTSAAGLVQLYDGIDSTSTTLAATAAAVKLAAESGVVPVMVETSGVSALPITLNNSGINANMVLLRAELSSPRAQTGAWTIETAAGSVTISGSINGTTDIRLILTEVL